MKFVVVWYRKRQTEKMVVKVRAGSDPILWSGILALTDESDEPPSISC